MLFQPTPPRGGRQKTAVFKHGGFVVSTHAPAWGATVTRVDNLEGWQFQPTPPRGGRPGWSKRPLRAESFNPRPRVGGDRAGQKGR